jgi:hypothetical protein
MDSKKGSPFGDNDLAPILQTPRASAEELDEEEYLARYGPPFGPCGHPCACAKCQDYRKKLKEQGPPPKRIPVITRDEFDRAIEKVLAAEPRDEWRETIRSQRCFARCWYDEDEKSYCTEMDCDLRRLCETTWESVRGGALSRDEDDSIIITPEPPTHRMIGGKLRKVYPVRSSKIKKSQWKGIGKYSRVPYVDQGRRVDQIAHELWTYLGSPPSLPSSWTYPVSQTLVQQEQARYAFVEVFGVNLHVVRRPSYHQYIHNGYHLMRLWTNAACGGWADCTQALARFLLADGRNMIEKTPLSGQRTKYRFYPYRVFLSKPSSVTRFQAALAQLPGFEYLSRGQASNVTENSDE